MLDKTPINEKGQDHNYWEVYRDDFWFKCHYVNGHETGYEIIQWEENKIEKIYRAI